MALKSILVKPKGVKSSNNRLQCSICKQRFWLACKFNDHMASHLLLFCNICNQYFYDQKLLDEHYLIHKDVINTYDCDKCSKKFLHKYELSHHLKSHNPSVNEPPSKRRKKSVHFNNVLEMKRIEEDFSDYDKEDESFYDKFSSRAIKTRSGRVVKVKKLYEDETDGEDEDDHGQSEDPHREVPLANESRDVDFVPRDTCKKTSATSENNKSLASNVVEKSNEQKGTQKSVSVNNLAARGVSRNTSVVSESNKTVTAAIVKKTNELLETQNSVSADNNNIARDISGKTCVVSENNKSATATIVKKTSELKETQKSVSADNNNIARDISRKTCVVSENNKSVASSSTKKARELKETQNSVSVDSNSSSIASSVSVNVNDSIKKNSDKQLRVIVEKLPNHIYQECVQKGNVCSYNIYDSADFKSIFREGHSANKTVDGIKKVPGKNAPGASIIDNNRHSSTVKVKSVIRSQSVSAQDSDKITANVVVNNPTASVSKITGRVKQCSKSAYAKKSTSAKSANSRSSVAREVYSNTLPRSPSHVNKQFVYVGSNPDMNKIKKVLAEISHLSKDDSTKSTSLGCQHSGMSQNLSSSNIQNSPLKSKTLPAPIAATAMKSQSFASTVKAITDDKTGILEKKVVDNFLVIKVTPEYMKKMQQTPLDIPKVLSSESCGQTKSVSNSRSNSSVSKLVKDKICDNQTTSPKGNTLSKNINSISPTNSNKTFKETRVTLAQLAAASPKIIDEIKQTSMKKAPAPSVKEGQFSIGNMQPLCEIEVTQKSKMCDAQSIPEALILHRKNDQNFCQNVPQLTSPVSPNKPTLSNTNFKESALAKSGKLDKHPKGGTQGNKCSSVKNTTVTVNGENVNNQITSHDVPDSTCAMDTRSNVNLKVSSFNANQLYSNINSSAFDQTNENDKDKTIEITSSADATAIDLDVSSVIQNLSKLVSLNVSAMNADSTESMKETSFQEKNDCVILETPKSDTGNDVDTTVDSTESMKETSSQKNDDCINLEAPKSDTGNISNTNIRLNRILYRTLSKKNDNSTSLPSVPKETFSKPSAVCAQSPKSVGQTLPENYDDCVIVLESITESVTANISKGANHSDTCMKEISSKYVDNQSSVHNTSDVVTSSALSKTTELNKIMNQTSKNNDSQRATNSVSESVTASILKKCTSIETDKETVLTKDGVNQKSSHNISKFTATVPEAVSKNCGEITSSAKHNGQSSVSLTSSDASDSMSCLKKVKPLEKDCQIPLSQSSDLPSTNASSITLRPRRAELDFSMKYKGKHSMQVASDFASINFPEEDTVKKLFSAGKDSQISSQDETEVTTSTVLLHSKKRIQSASPTESPKLRAKHKNFTKESPKTKVRKQSHLATSTSASYEIKPRRAKLDFSTKYNGKQISRQIASDLVSINCPQKASRKELSSAGKGNEISSQGETKVTTGTVLLRSKKQIQFVLPTESLKTKQVPKQPHLTTSTSASCEIKKDKIDKNKNKLSESSRAVVSEVDKICTVSIGQTNSVCEKFSSVSLKDKMCEVEKSTKDESSSSSTVSQRLATIKNIQNEIDAISAQNKHEKSKVEKLLELYKAKMEEKERRKREKYDFKKKVREFLRN